MPELPEVEVVVRQLRAELRGLTLGSVRVRHRDVFRPATGLTVEDTRGHRVVDVTRRAKLILIPLSGSVTLTVHLRMTGRVEVCAPARPIALHTHVVVPLSDGRELRFVDPRRFGRVQLLDERALARDSFLARLGPEPLEMSCDELDRGLASRVGSLKGALLDQSLVAGLGNIYADEILFRAALHPRLVACRLSTDELRRLHEEMRAVLQQAIEGGGSTISDYRSLRRPGSFQTQHRVFGRAGQACLRCGTSIRKIRVAGRGTHICPTCQPHRRRRRARRIRARAASGGGKG